MFETNESTLGGKLEVNHLSSSFENSQDFCLANASCNKTLHFANADL
jgi:hypothetical protein